MPHDFRNKSFQKVLRGYAPDEVEEYIAYLNEEYRKLEQRTTDSERKLALALKKLYESTKNGSTNSVGPAAREEAAKLLRKAESEASGIVAKAEEQAEEKALEIVHKAQVQAQAVVVKAAQQAESGASGIIAKAEQQAEEKAMNIVHKAQVQAQSVVVKAAQQAEVILAGARAEAAAHRDEVKKAQDTAKSIYDEIGSFRDRLFALYNEHLDALEGVTDVAQEFMEAVDVQTGTALAEDIRKPEEEVSESEKEIPEIAEEELPESAEDALLPEKTECEDAEEQEMSGEPDDSAEEAEMPEEAPDADELASNLAFMDRLFANLQTAEETVGDDLYIDIPEEEDFDLSEYQEMDESADVVEEAPEGDDMKMEDEFPAFMIDWKNRSAVSALEEEEAYGTDEADGETVSESDDFRSADGFEKFEEEVSDFEEEVTEENYDDYSPEELPEEEETADEEYEETEEEQDEYHDMDQIFNEDKSKREMSLTDEFNIIFDDSKSNQNVKEISRQPILTPDNPKNAKKHKKF